MDLDGVMVPANAWKQPAFLADGFPAFSAKATEALRKIISETNVDIVLTSSHKSNYSNEEWMGISRQRGLNIGRIDKLPDNVGHLTRKEELQNWLRGEKADEDFVIIDDDKSLNALLPSLKEKLVMTSGAIGLTDGLANDAIAILTRNTASAA